MSPEASDHESADAEARVDDALARTHAHADENDRGFTSHAPMVVDALVALGRTDHIEPFLDAYLPGFPTLAAGRASSLASASPWSEVLEPGRDWAGVLDRALDALAPAFFSAATHGLIRVAHAVRGLDRRDTPVRRRELARALAYWRASEATLPGRPGAAPASAGPRLAARDLIERLEVVPNERRSSGLFTEGVKALDSHTPFAEAIERLEIPDRVDGAAISGLTRAMLAPYLESPLLRIAYVHTITAPSALRLVAHHVRPETLRRLYGHGVQSVAALHAVSKLPTEHAVTDETEALAGDVEALATRAAGTLEEHVVKFTEACLREHAESGDERFLLAAADATLAEETRTRED